MTLYAIFTVIILHFVFDWFQPRSIQNNKHAEFSTLLWHALISTFPFIIWLFMFNADIILVIYLICLLYGSHVIIDLISSNAVEVCKMFHYEYGVITITAVDQILHLLIYFFVFNKLYLLTT